ncbi:sirohydrochlorin chelatase [Jiangella gansuensis]|uniref:sirohydrochlorin chelatase n=1 Tax=Jiangella gansuensis TaxID=281473 RepID=UPI001B7F91DB|nr:sirohydrochlorin chelatase [Jiangella gansuensis]
MSDRDVLVAVAHGTRAPAGPVVLEELLGLVRDRLPGVDVRVAYVDVIGPTLEEVLTDLGGRAIVVPMFLASGYHVRVDVPAAVTATGSVATVTPALGPDPAIVAAVADRLATAGASGTSSSGAAADSVVLAAAGSSDQDALAEVGVAADRLATVLGVEVVPAYVTTAAPAVGQAVADLRAAGHRRVAVASYLLAPGLFQQRLSSAGADVVAEPIGPHPLVADLIVARYQSAARS